MDSCYLIPILPRLSHLHYATSQYQLSQNIDYIVKYVIIIASLVSLSLSLSVTTNQNWVFLV